MLVSGFYELDQDSRRQIIIRNHTTLIIVISIILMLTVTCEVILFMNIWVMCFRHFVHGHPKEEKIFALTVSSLYWIILFICHAIIQRMDLSEKTIIKIRLAHVFSSVFIFIVLLVVSISKNLI